MIDLVLPGGRHPFPSPRFSTLTALGLGGKLRTKIDFNSGVSANKLGPGTTGSARKRGLLKFP